MKQRHIIDRLLKHGEDIGPVICFLTLLLVETGYVAWLERLPAFPRRNSQTLLSRCRRCMGGQGLK